MQTDLEYRIDMKKEKNFSETDFQKKALESLSDDEILQGFKDADARIVREYYYGYCRVAYCIYDKRYDLQHKPGMDFFSLAHEYYLYLCEHDFKPLEDRKPSMSLKTWMVNGFRFLLLVCYDLRFPVWSRNRGDYDAILCSASWADDRREVWRTLLRARAIENQCYLAGVNRVGTDPDASYAGDSALVDFRGATLADAGEREQTLVAEFDSDAQAAFREEFPAWMDADGFELKF